MLQQGIKSILTPIYLENNRCYLGYKKSFIHKISKYDIRIQI
jgi:hypothetical protein